MNDGQRTIFILSPYLKALLNFIEENQDKASRDLVIRSTSHIINEPTARRVGFTVVPTDSLQKMILIYNYFNILIGHSIATGRFSFPKGNQTKGLEAKLSELISKRDFIGHSIDQLEQCLDPALRSRPDVRGSMYRNENNRPEPAIPCLKSSAPAS